MDSVNIEEQIARADWPPGVQVRAYSEGGVDGTVFRIVQRTAPPEGAAPGTGVKRGLEIVLSAGAARMYGEGPMVATVLQELRRHLDAGLPTVQPGQEYERLTYEGD